MKLLTRLRELREHSPVDELFDNFHYSPESYRADTIGIGSMSHEDIVRLDFSSHSIESIAARKD